MKTLFIPVRYTEKIALSDKHIAKLPQRIGLVATTQFTHQLPAIAEQLKNAGKEAYLEKGFQPVAGQILGCDVSAAKKISGKVNAFLYIGDGQFHPIGLGLFGAAVFCYDPYVKKFYELDKKHIEQYEKRKKGAVLKFMHAETIGILVSLKHGQANMRKAFTLREKLKHQGKKSFIFLFDTLQFHELENFPFVDCFVNTACPRIMDDYDKFQKPVVNYLDIISTGFKQ